MFVVERIKAGGVKSEYLKLMAKVERTRQKSLSHNANVPPIEKEEMVYFGQLKGTLYIKGDITAPVDEEWDANS